MLANGNMDIHVAAKASLVVQLLTRARAERGLPPVLYLTPEELTTQLLPTRVRAGDLLGKNHRCATRDDHRVLKLSHQTAIICAQRPAILIIDDKTGGYRQERFHGEDHSLVQEHPLAIVKTWYGRFFVKTATDAVSIEIPHHAKALSTRARLDRLANIAKSVARSCREHRVALSEPSGLHETSGDCRNHSDGRTHASIGEIPVKFRGHIDIDEVTLAKVASKRGNTVSGLVVDADTSGSGKVVRHSRGRSCAVAAKGPS
jgi:hypothetical protein